MNLQSESVPQKLDANRFYNLFNPCAFRGIIIYNAILLIALVYRHFAGGGSVLVALFTMVIVNVFLIPEILLHFPKSIVISEDKLEFDDYVSMRPRLRGGKGFFWLKVSYSVSDIQNVEFHQGKMEKKLGIGHLSFSGKAVFRAKRDVDRIKEKNSFVIYGIKESDFLEIEHLLRQNQKSR